MLRCYSSYQTKNEKVSYDFIDQRKLNLWKIEIPRDKIDLVKTASLIKTI